ncbi:hypothetical protein AMATHDRAFT_75290 [Amanita thiersii Skay4041]|uniref:F-box domain-containing protein n=1 Tax=Amanita thiersii Skay4041 TaxID=703135 RepID=A0A2A9NT91_9AGAR|nr:hypothetical protein AMATHDRAFT_75290 [Amanita thiersii Skay4041]
MSGKGSSKKFTFDFFLYDELILCIFSHLSWVDLCAVQATSRKWSRLATDNELWRNLYFTVFGRTRLRGARGFTGRLDGREVRPLPSRVKTGEFKDWKWMFRISSNWRKGRCMVEQLQLLPPAPLEDVQSAKTHILLAGSLIVTASSKQSLLPCVHLSGPDGLYYDLPCPSRQPALFHVTALALDQSPPISRDVGIAAFLSTGEFHVFRVDYSNPTSSTLQLSHSPIRRTSRTSPIIQAVYHHPILITLSESFSLSIYDLSSGLARHSQTLSSYTSHPPTSLVLSTPTATTYKLVLTYAVPVYPRHWSVGITELIISAPSSHTEPLKSSTSPSATFAEESSYNGAELVCVTATRTIRAVDIPHGWIDEEKLRVIQEQWSRKVTHVADTQTDGKWVVLAPGGPLPTSRVSSSSSPHSPSHIYSPTSLQLYRLSLPLASSAISAPRPRLTFMRNLHGHTCPVSSMSVADGRCVSLGIDGSIWVWDLETGASTEVLAQDPEVAHPSTHGGIQFEKCMVAFDERRIVTAQGDCVRVRRFDI